MCYQLLLLHAWVPAVTYRPMQKKTAAMTHKQLTMTVQFADVQCNKNTKQCAANDGNYDDGNDLCVLSNMALKSTARYECISLNCQSLMVDLC